MTSARPPKVLVFGSTTDCTHISTIKSIKDSTIDSLTVLVLDDEWVWLQEADLYNTLLFT
jgi:hypothetical protein